MNGLIYFLGATMLGVLILAAFAIVLFVLYIITGYAIGVIRLRVMNVELAEPMKWHKWWMLYGSLLRNWLTYIDQSFPHDGKRVPIFGWSRVTTPEPFYGA